jgi:BirA family biotin operon repressor/biotin-[acetyl-CoA-carboxylase] ligase
VLKFTDHRQKGEMEPMQAYDQFALSAITSLCVVELLSEHGIKAKIKWPNDIYVGNSKICGILIENALRGEWISYSIIGIGLNVNQRNFDVNLPNTTSMALCLDQTLSLPGLLEEFMQTFRGYWRRYLNITGGLMRVRRLYLSQMWHKDSPARYLDTVSGKEFIGIIRGMSDIGHLVVEDTEKGELKEFAFKEISYII